MNIDILRKYPLTPDHNKCIKNAINCKKVSFVVKKEEESVKKSRYYLTGVHISNLKFSRSVIQRLVNKIDGITEINTAGFVKLQEFEVKLNRVTATSPDIVISKG